MLVATGTPASLLTRMQPAMLIGCVVTLAAALLYLFVLLGQTHQRMEAGKNLAAATVQYSRDLGTGNPSALVIGDSIAFGVGATTPDRSLAGQIGSRRPDLSIVNRARIGGDASELAADVYDLVAERHEAVFISIGGNDVVRHSIDIDNSIVSLQLIISHAAQYADNVYLFTPSDFASVGAIPAPLRAFYSGRSERIRLAALQLEQKYSNFDYVDLFDTNGRGLAGRQAADGFHPNDAGVTWMVDAALGPVE